MKKVISIVLALVMMMAICVPAFADELNAANPSGDVIVKTSTELEGGGSAERFVVTIPASPTTMAWGTDSKDLVYSVESHLAWGKAVSVTVSGHGVMTYSPDANNTLELAYTLGGETAFTANSPVVYPAAEKTISVAVSTEAWNGAVIGEYSDTLTFTASVA